MRALDDAARLGGFFTLPYGPPPPAYRPWSELPAALPGLVSALATTLAAEERVAQSVLQLSLATRLWSPVAACLAYGTVPDLSTLWWSGTSLWLASPGEAADPYAEVSRALSLPFDKVPPRLQLGNAASALAGAAAQLRRQTGSHAGSDLLAELLAGPYAGLGVEGPPFRRTTCCLLYRSPGRPLCPDCALDRIPGHLGR